MQTNLSVVGENVFNRGVYADYLDQLKLFLNKQLAANPALREIPFINDFFAQNEPRKKHEAFIDGIRSYIDNNRQSDPRKKHEAFTDNNRGCNTDEFIEDLVTWIYTQPDLNKSLENVLSAFVPLDQDGDLPSQASKISTLLAGHEKLYKPDIRCNDADNHRMGNLPRHVWTYKNCRILSSPTVCYTDTEYYKIVPEFFLFALKVNALSQKIFYFNFMMNNKKERNLSDMIYENGKILSSMSVFSLERTSPYYYAKGDFSDDNCPNWSDINKYKDVHRIIFPKLCRWPPNLTHEQISSLCSEAIEFVHAHYFDKTSTFKAPDRHLFNEIVYLQLVNKLLETETPQYALFACKMSMDRCPSFLAALYLLQDQQAGIEISSDRIKNCLNILFSPAIAVLNRSIYDYRVETFSGVAALIMRGKRP